MYRFTAVPHVLLYSSAINNVPGTVYCGRTPDDRVRALSFLFLWVFFRIFFPFFFSVGEWVNGFLNNVLLTAAVGLQMSGFEPSLLSFCFFFALFSVLCFWVGEGV